MFGSDPSEGNFITVTFFYNRPGHLEWLIGDSETINDESVGHCTRLRSIRKSQQKLEGLFYQQKNILDNHLNRLMIDPNGKADAITPDEIIGAYEIATIHNGHPSYFLSGWEGKD